MSSRYEFWLTDDGGRRTQLLKRYAFAAYTRTIQGFPTINIGLPYDWYSEKVPSLFERDWRVDVWRSPGFDYPMRREQSFLLRKYQIYDRQEDAMRMIQFWGRGAIDLLRRTNLAEDPGIRTDTIDAIMIDVANAGNAQAGYPTGEYDTESDLDQGPSITSNLTEDLNGLDTLKNLSNTSFYMNTQDPDNNRKIYFGMIESEELGVGGGFGYKFITRADLWGADRTNQGVIFSVENGNLRAPSYSEDYLNEFNDATVVGTGVRVDFSTTVDKRASRWNECYLTRYSAEVDEDAAESFARQLLSENKGQKVFSGTFLNSPGGPTQPPSLYGVHWDLGDKVLVEYADKLIEAEIKIVYVSVNDDGEETITARNEVG